MTNQHESNTNIFIAMMLIATLSGCTMPIKPVVLESQGISHKYEKNYVLNETKSVYVGDPIVRVRDYYVEKFNVPVVVPSEDFSVQTGLLKMDYVKGKKYPISGNFEYNGKSYFVVRSDKHTIEWSQPAVLIEKDGTIRYAVATGDGVRAIVQPSFNLTPNTATMTPLFEERISVTKAYENFELLFNGLDKNAMTFTYREFSPEGMARVAFYQTLTYDAKAPTIRFKRFKINVINASSEGITYAVVEDSK